MDVAIDARELAGHRTGAGRYLERLLSAWAGLEAAGGHAFTLYAHRPVSSPRGLGAQVKVLPGAGGTRWEQVTLAWALRRHPPDVLFAPAYTAPLAIRVPVALTLHDVSFLAHPEWFRPRERWRRRVLTRASARRAAVILTVSGFSRGEIERRLGIPGGRIRVVAHGIDQTGLPPSAPPEMPQSALPGAREQDPIVLYVGSLLNRRHVPELVEAAALAIRQVPALRLVLVGDNRTWPRQDPAALARRLGISRQVDVRSFVPDAELRHLYDTASVFAFLSDYEGFGLTPLEALAAGIPPIVLDTPVAREVYGNAARYVARPDPEIVSAAIVEMLTSGGARAELLAAAPGVLGRYRWSDAAAATLAAIEEAAGR